MEKTIKVEGMMCQHCVAHGKKALEGAAAGCNVAVDLDAGKAVVSGKTLPEDAVLTAAVTEAGYKVVDIVNRSSRCSGPRAGSSTACLK